MTVPVRRVVRLVTQCPDRGPRPYVALENVESGTGRLIDADSLPEREVPESGAAAVEPGSVLFGKLRPYLAKSWLVDRPVYASTELLALEPGHDVESRWLGYVCLSRPFVDWSVATSDGAKMPRTSWAKLREFRLDVPPISAQREIADFLDAETARIDALIEKKQRMVALLDERRLGLIVDVLRDEGQATALRRIFRVVNGGTPTSDESNWHGDVPWATPVDLGAVDGKRITSTARSLTRQGLLAGSSSVPEGSIIVSTRAPIGYVAETTCEMAFNQGCRGLVPRAELDVRYFRYQLIARRPELVALGQGSTFSELSSDALAAFKVACPPLSRQRLVADRLDTEAAFIDTMVEKTRRAIALLRERRQALITAAVTGQLDLSEAAA